MTLATEFIARYSERRVKDLTLPDRAGTDSYDATILGYACTDAAAEFETLVQVAFDVSNANHLRVALLLVEAHLLDRGAGRTDEAGKRREMAEKRAEALRKVTGRGRVMPQTSSTLSPSGDGAGVQRPHFDPLRTRDVIPDAPGAGSTDPTVWP